MRPSERSRQPTSLAVNVEEVDSRAPLAPWRVGRHGSFCGSTGAPTGLTGEPFDRVGIPVSPGEPIVSHGTTGRVSVLQQVHVLQTIEVIVCLAHKHEAELAHNGQRLGIVGRNTGHEIPDALRPVCPLHQ
jgi:hypothetical protein